MIFEIETDPKPANLFSDSTLLAPELTWKLTWGLLSDLAINSPASSDFIVKIPDWIEGCFFTAIKIFFL